MMEWDIDLCKGHGGLLDEGCSMPRYTNGKEQSNVQVMMEQKIHGDKGSGFGKGQIMEALNANSRIWTLSARVDYM